MPHITVKRKKILGGGGESTLQIPEAPRVTKAEYKNAVETLETKIRSLEKKGTENSPVEYNGHPAFFYIKYMDLIDKYDVGCVYDNKHLSNIDINFMSKPPITTNIDELGNHLKECIDRGISLIAIPLTMNSYVNIEDAGGGHMNMIIIKPLLGTVERFDPNGILPDIFENLADVALKKLFETDLTRYIGKVTYKKTIDTCPRSNLQAIESSIPASLKDSMGYCQMWAVLFAEIMMMNPDKTTEEIFEEMHAVTKSDPAYLRAVIRGYVMEAVNIMMTITNEEEEEAFFSKIINKAKAKIVKKQTPKGSSPPPPITKGSSPHTPPFPPPPPSKTKLSSPHTPPFPPPPPPKTKGSSPHTPPFPPPPPPKTKGSSPHTPPFPPPPPSKTKGSSPHTPPFPPPPPSKTKGSSPHTEHSNNKTKSVRCPRGTRRNKKTGLCEPIMTDESSGRSSHKSKVKDYPDVKDHPSPVGRARAFSGSHSGEEVHSRRIKK